MLSSLRLRSFLQLLPFFQLQNLRVGDLLRLITVKEIDHPFDRFGRHSDHTLVGQSRRMRCEDHVIQFKKGIIFLDGFLFKNIESGPVDDTFFLTP